ncbi:hypothetical protein BH11ACT8_BH11ACT8_34780 [soil metagenome]
MHSTALDVPHLTTHLAGLQRDSAQALARLDPTTVLLPTHGLGGFCAGGATAPGGAPTTLGDLLTSHPALSTGRETFVTDLVAGFGPTPAYAAHMAPLNRIGAGDAPARPARPVTGEDVTDAVLAGSWVIDVRSRTTFAAGHLPGAVNVEYSAQFATYVG